jgi:sulfonate transport system ATP-binding protein
MNAIAVRGLGKTYGERSVIEDFSLDVARGEVVAILGPSGCGKSTILRCIGRIERADAGTIETGGEVGFVFQEPRLFPWLTVRKNVAFAARNNAERERVDETISLVGLVPAADQLPKRLSGGMAQRAALARALIRHPEVLLLDEPLAALDALRRLELQRALGQILSVTRAAAVLVTHDVDEAIAVADRAVVLEAHGGRVALDIAVSRDARAGEPEAHAAQRAALLRALGVAEGDARRTEPVLRPRSGAPSLF